MARDQGSGGSGGGAGGRPSAAPNPLRSASVPRTRIGGGGNSKLFLPRYEGAGAIPVLDHRNTPSPWASANNSSSADDGAEEMADLGSGAELSPADRARTIMSNSRTGTLGVAVGSPAAPLGFVLNYSLTEAGHPIVCVRSSVERAGRLAAGASASFTVADTPLTAVQSSSPGAVTLLGKLSAIAFNDKAKYFAIHTRAHAADSAAVQREEANLFVIDVLAVLVSGAHIDLARVGFEEYSAASPDPLAAVAPGLAAHLSGDQNGSLVLLTRAFGGVTDARSARLMGIDRFGMDLIVTTAKSDVPVRLPFPQPVSGPDDVRRELNTMVRGARFKLGVG